MAYHRPENDNSSTAHQFSCCVHRLKRKPTLARPAARNSRYGIGGGRCGGCVSHGQELSTSPSYCCCCEPEFDPAPLLMPTRCSELAEHAMHPGAVAARSGSKQRPRELRAQRRHVLGNGGRGSILTASPFSYSSTIGLPAANFCLL